MTGGKYVQWFYENYKDGNGDLPKMTLAASEILDELRSKADPRNVAGMARYGINPVGTLGISMLEIRRIAKRIGKDQLLAEHLWDSGVHEARILASLIADPALLTEELMNRWVYDFDSWDVCDQVCSNLFAHSPIAVEKAVAWIHREETFVRRAGFVMVAALAVHDKKLADEQFEAFLPLIIAYATDDRNFVKKANNWALRQIGKRNLHLNQCATVTALELSKSTSRSARWIAADALRELTGDKIQQRLSKPGKYD